MKAILLIFITLISFNAQAAVFGPPLLGPQDVYGLDCHTVNPVLPAPPNAWYFSQQEIWFCARVEKVQEEAGVLPGNPILRWEYNNESGLFTMFDYTNGQISGRHMECIIPDTPDNVFVRFMLSHKREIIYKLYVGLGINITSTTAIYPNDGTCAVVRLLPVN
jgi:hypothetical protein